MKKYSHLFLLVVLLNATSIAQNTQPGAQSATATESLSKTAATALQSLGKAAVAMAPIAAITAPAMPSISPASTLKVGAELVTEAAKEVAKPRDAVGAQKPTSGRGIRNSASRKLKGQSTGDEKIDSFIVSAATRHGIEPLLLYSVMCQESAFKHRAVSPKGARGLMQLMPATAARFGVKDIFDPEQNIEAGARYLSFLLDIFDGDVSLALAGYNAGEGAVRKYGYTVPPYRETINYVRKIKRRYTDFRAMPDQNGAQPQTSDAEIVESESQSAGNSR